jgi:hypothetical protein
MGPWDRIKWGQRATEIGGKEVLEWNLPPEAIILY